mmetsp:Transcript_12118/g.25015  ORF Transcript_12118/g.25015 Transcript_12118/m.25015 type:complete len:205 (-) Transcript_12118:1070-1684(-)
MFLPLIRTSNTGRLVCALMAPVSFPITGGYGHHSPRTSPDFSAKAVLCNGQTMQSSQPSCLSMLAISFSWKNSLVSRGWTLLPVVGGFVFDSMGRRSRLPTSRGVPRCGQELATQWTAEPSLEATSNRSMPAAVMGTISPGAIRVLGATTIHCSAFPSKTPETNFWAADTTPPRRWDLLLLLLLLLPLLEDGFVSLFANLSLAL